MAEEPNAESAEDSQPTQARPPMSEPTAAGTEPRKLRRSRRDRVIAGVCGGLGEYFAIDPVLIRIAAVILVFAGGAGILLYAIGWIVIPEAPEATPGGVPMEGPPAQPARSTGAVVLGLVFVVLGIFFLVHQRWPDFLAWKYVWPILLIAVGAAIVIRSRR